MSAKPAPLRKIERTYREPVDDRLYDVLECGHSIAWSGAKRRRCSTCAHEIRRGVRRD